MDLESVIFCDNHLLVVSKPADLLTQPDSHSVDSLQTQAKAWIKERFSKPGAVFLHAVHRLDRPVSGLVLFARTSKALSRLNEQSRNLEIQRIYIAEVDGILPIKNGGLKHFLLHGDHRAEVVSEKTPGAKIAKLTYEVIQYKAHSTLVKIELETGRYHQIRAQFSAAGHPIIGDEKYGAKRSNRVHLHCAEIELMHPVTKEVLRFESASPF